MVEEAIGRHLDEARGTALVTIQILSCAVEIPQISWELLMLRPRHVHLGSSGNVLVHYALPAIKPARPPDKPSKPRILFAWSAAGGAIPHQEHLKALEAACQSPPAAFQPGRKPHGDIVDNVSGPTLSAALQSEPPVSIVHIVCHSVYQNGAFCLQWRDPERGLIPIDPSWLSAQVGSHAASLRLVVLCACDSGNAGPGGHMLGSLAEALHRAGIEHVIAARYPLDSGDSIAFTKYFYEQHVGKRATVEAAFIAARKALIAARGIGGCAEMVLYSHPPLPKERPPRHRRLMPWMLLALLGLAALLAFPAIHRQSSAKKSPLASASIDARSPDAGARDTGTIEWPRFGDEGGLALILASSDEKARQALSGLHQYIRASETTDAVPVQVLEFPRLAKKARPDRDIAKLLNDLEEKGKATNTAVIAMVDMDHNIPMLRIIVVKKDRPIGPDILPPIRLADPEVQREVALLLMAITAAATTQLVNYTQAIPIPTHASVARDYKVLALVLRSAKGETLAEEHESRLRLQDIHQVCKSLKWQESMAKNWSCAQAYLLHVQHQSSRCSGDMSSSQVSDADLELLGKIGKQRTYPLLKQMAKLLLIRELCRRGDRNRAHGLAKEFLDEYASSGAERSCQELMLIEVADCLSGSGLADIDFQDFQHCPAALVADARAYHANNIAPQSGDTQRAAEAWNEAIRYTDEALKTNPSNPHMQSNLAEYKLHRAVANGPKTLAQELAKLGDELSHIFDRDNHPDTPHPPEVTIHRRFLLVRAFGANTSLGEPALRELCQAYDKVAESDFALCDRGRRLRSLACNAQPNAATCGLYKELIRPKKRGRTPALCQSFLQ